MVNARYERSIYDCLFDETNKVRDALEHAIEELIKLSFVKRKAFLERDSISLHPLIHRWASERLDDTEKQQTARDLVRLVTSVVDTDIHKMDYAFANRLRGHFELCSRHISRYLDSFPQHKSVYLAISNVGKVYFNLGEYSVAEGSLKVALAGLEMTNEGEGESVEVLDTVHNLAGVFQSQGE